MLENFCILKNTDKFDDTSLMLTIFTITARNLLLSSVSRSKNLYQHPQRVSFLMISLPWILFKLF